MLSLLNVYIKLLFGTQATKFGAFLTHIVAYHKASGAQEASATVPKTLK